MWRELVLICLFSLCYSQVEMTGGLPGLWNGTWQALTFKSYGWQRFQRMELNFTLLDPETEGIWMCTGFPNKSRVEGKMVGFLFPPATTYWPWIEFDGEGCAYQRMISNCLAADCAGMLHVSPLPANSDIFYPLVRDWWWSRTASYF